MKICRRMGLALATLTALTLVAGALVLSAGSEAASAPGNGPAGETPATERVALLPFWVFDERGNPVPRTADSDLARLASVLPRSIGARLVQSGAFEVHDAPLLDARGMTPADGDRELDRVEQLLRSGQYDQVITGTVAQVERAVITSLSRYVLGEAGPVLVGASVVRSNSPSEVVSSVDMLLTQAFPPDADVVLRPISRIVVIPSVLRVPVGRTVPLQAHAIDDLGRPLPNVQLIFQTNDESRATVDENGNVTGISPGRAQINLQPLGRPLAGGATPQVDVTVVGPNLGMRVGAGFLAGETPVPRIGLRLTPGQDLRTTPRNPTQDLPTAGTNPTNFLTSFFAALIGNQMLTLDLDVTPSQDIAVTLDAVQRTVGGFFGTGVGVTVPLREDGPSGINLRLTFGTQLPFSLRDNATLPVEVNVDFVLGNAQTPPVARMGVAFGIDIFQ